MLKQSTRCCVRSYRVGVRVRRSGLNCRFYRSGAISALARSGVLGFALHRRDLQRRSVRKVLKLSAEVDRLDATATDDLERGWGGQNRQLRESRGLLSNLGGEKSAEPPPAMRSEHNRAASFSRATSATSVATRRYESTTDEPPA